MFLYIFLKIIMVSSWLAQSEENTALDLSVISLILTRGVEVTKKKKINKKNCESLSLKNK